MCAIIDANVTFEVFGSKQTEAGIQFRNWLDSGRGKLVVGGKKYQRTDEEWKFH